MNIYFDTEFTGLDHRNPQLISIGMVAETGEKFYAEFTDYNESLINPWVQKNVIDNLYLDDFIPKIYDDATERVRDIDGVRYSIGPTEWNKDSIEDWLEEVSNMGDKTIQLVSDVCHYDMYLLCNQVFGGAFNLPSFVNPVCYDICQDIAKFTSGNPRDCAECMKIAFDMTREDLCKAFTYGKGIEGKKHNSLYDAEVIKVIYEGMTMSWRI